MEPATFSLHWKQSAICRCHKVHRSFHDLRNDVSKMRFSIIILSTLMYALEKSCTHFSSPHSCLSRSSWLDQHYLHLVSSAHNEIPHCAIFSTTQLIPAVLPKYLHQLPVLERPQPVHIWYYCLRLISYITCDKVTVSWPQHTELQRLLTELVLKSLTSNIDQILLGRKKERYLRLNV